eukprot:8893116-Pyramimonas_sp.AAC.1
MQHPAEEEEVAASWSEMELPEVVRQDIMTNIPRSTRRAVRKAHRGLGRPSRPTFIKMMRLGGAMPNALAYAKHWQCPTCA